MSSSILKELISGVSKSKSIIVCDSTDQSGHELVQTFLKKPELSSNVKLYHIIFDEVGHSSWESSLSITSRKVVPSFDLWLKPDFQKLDLLAQVQDLKCKTVVFIDSLSCAMIKFDTQQLYLELAKLIGHEDVIQLICQLHQDVVDPTDAKLLTSLFSTIIRTEPPENNTKCQAYSLQHYKLNGKFFTERGQLFFNDVGELTIQPFVKEEKGKQKVADQASEPVHDTFSTFRHGLTIDEIQARDKLVLPYQQIADKREGKIEYEPEDDDEWDEEDPDEDLEI